MDIMQRITPTTNIGNSKSLTSSIKGITYILNSIQMTPTKMEIPNNIFCSFLIIISYSQNVIVFTDSILLISIRKKTFLRSIEE